MTDPHHARDDQEFRESAQFVKEAGQYVPDRTNLRLEQLDNTDLAGRKRWRLMSDFRHRIGPGNHATVPEGYVTSFSPVPRILYWFIPAATVRELTLVWDWMRNQSYTIGKYVYDSGWDGPMADALLKERMRDMGLGWCKRNLAYVAVRLSAIFHKDDDT